MRKFPLVMLFIALAFFCWGVYGPLLFHGQLAMKGSRMRPFLCVGLAYFLVAVIVPLAILWTQGEKGRWTLTGLFWSLTAGALGALGALGTILAFTNWGNPQYVMPLVFGGAPVVNTFFTMWLNKTWHDAGALYYLGLVLAAGGAAGVLFTKPEPEVTITQPDEDTYHVEWKEPNGKTGEASGTHRELQAKSPKAYRFLKLHESRGVTEVIYIGLSVLLTVLSWGCYGPVLHVGQMRMEGSRLRPFLCVGLAYFAIAVLIPTMYLGAFSEPGEWMPKAGPDEQPRIDGILWSLGGGVAGAIGALGIIMAFNFGGKPTFVMPLVFGIAPVVNTFFTIIDEGQWGGVSTSFFGSLGVVIAGAAMVLVFAPKAHAPPPGGGAPAASHGTAAGDSGAPADKPVAGENSSSGDPAHSSH